MQPKADLRFGVRELRHRGNYGVEGFGCNFLGVAAVVEFRGFWRSQTRSRTTGSCDHKYAVPGGACPQRWNHDTRVPARDTAPGTTQVTRTVVGMHQLVSAVCLCRVSVGRKRGSHTNNKVLQWVVERRLHMAQAQRWAQGDCAKTSGATLQ